MGNNNLELLKEEYLVLKPNLPQEVQEHYEKVFQLLQAEHQAKIQYRRQIAMLLGLPVDNYSCKFDPEN